MNNKTNKQIQLFEKDSPKDLRFRGFSYDDALKYNLLNSDISEKRFRQEVKGILLNDEFKNLTFLYKLEFVKQNTPLEKIKSILTSTTSSKFTPEEALSLGVKRGSENTGGRIRKGVLAKYVGLEQFYKNFVIENRKRTNIRKYGVEHAPQNQAQKEKFKNTCLKKYGKVTNLQTDETKLKIKATNLKKYGVEYISQSPEFKEKFKQTCLDKYGKSHHSQNQEIKDKKKRSSQIKYGTDCPFQAEEIKEKIKKVFIDKYGVDNPSLVPKIRRKAEQTCLERYGNIYPARTEQIKQKEKEIFLSHFGVSNPMYAEETKINNIKKYGVDWPMQAQTPKQKSFETKRKNGTFNTSKPENELEKVLKDKFSEVYRNYNKDSRYPFLCDFFIPSEDLFIELNLHWTHGGHEYDENNIKDQEKLKIWQEKAENGSKYYKNAIEVWTKRDKLKYKTARDNNLNYRIIWNKQDLNNFIQELSKNEK